MMNITLMIQMFVQSILILLFTHEVQSIQIRKNCSNTQQIKAPPVELRYMLNYNLHIIWLENATIGYNYTPQVCCLISDPSLPNGCPKTCPYFIDVKSCVSHSAVQIGTYRRCIVRVSELFRYGIRLIRRNVCNMTGQTVYIKPQLRTYPNSVSRLAVERIANGLIIEWAKPDRFITYWYLLSCKEKSVNSNSKGRDVKVYFCCVRAYIPPYNQSSSYFSEVCTDSKPAKELSVNVRCDKSHTCVNATVNELTSFSGRFKVVDDSKWPNLPPLIRVRVRKF